VLGLRVCHSGTYLATLKAVAKKYPHKSAGRILADMTRTAPGEDRRHGNRAV
jgi:hypothetical protein